MTNSFQINQFDVNKSTQQSFRAILRQTYLVLYDATKFFFNFIAGMIKMIIGK